MAFRSSLGIPGGGDVGGSSVSGSVDAPIFLLIQLPFCVTAWLLPLF